jgi:hypothetical protein
MKEDEMGRSYSTHGREKMHKNFGSKLEGNRPFGRCRHIREDNIRMELTENGWEGVYWIQLVQDRNQWQDLVTTVMNL